MTSSQKTLVELMTDPPMNYQMDNFMLLCKVVIDGRQNLFMTENSVACLLVDGIPWTMRGTKIPQGVLYEFVDDV